LTILYRATPEERKGRNAPAPKAAEIRERSLRVVSFPQGDGYVPSVRVAGKWLADFGFEVGREVVLVAREGEILIRRG